MCICFGFLQLASQTHGWSEKFLQGLRSRATEVYSTDPAQKERVLKLLEIAEAKLEMKLQQPLEIKQFSFDGIVGYGSFGKVWKVSKSILFVKKNPRWRRICLIRCTNLGKSWQPWQCCSEATLSKSWKCWGTLERTGYACSFKTPTDLRHSCSILWSRFVFCPRALPR